MRVNPGPELISFNHYIHIFIPKRWILKYLNQSSIPHVERFKLLRTLREIEQKINQLEHCRSLVEKCLLKEGVSGSMGCKRI